MDVANLERVKDLLSTVGKAQRDYKTYPSKHPLLLKRREELWGKFDTLLAGETELPLKVESEALLWGDILVYQNVDRRESISFNLHRNGIREIRFVQGLTREEIDALIGALNQDLSRDDSDEDLVTLLWTRDLPHVRYDAIDDSDPSLTWARDPGGALQMHMGSQREVPGSDKFVVAIRMEGGKPARDPRADIQAVMLSPEEIGGIKHLLDEDDKRDLVLHVIEILIEVLRAGPDATQARNLLKILEAVIDISIEERNFARASTTLRTIADLQTHLPGLAPTLRGTIAKFAEPKAMKTLVDVVSHPPDETHRPIEELDLFRFLTLLTKAAVVPLAEAMAVINDRKLRKTFCEALAELVKSDVNLLAGLSRDNRWFVARNVSYILGLTKNPESLRILKALSMHPNEKVRAETVRAAALMGAGAKEIVNRALTDGDRAVRLLAFDVIGPFRDDTTPAILAAQLQEKEFEAKDGTEKRAVALAAARILGDHALAPLSVLLTRRRILQSGTQDDTRAAAGAAIAAIGSAAAVDYLKQGAASQDTGLAAACQQALREARLA